MTDITFTYPIQIRYADIDAQRHVNSACYFTYMEQVRMEFLQQLGLWDGTDFDAIGIILADQRCTYRKPICMDQDITIGVSVEHLGKKSFQLRYSLREQATEQEMAVGETVLVAFDYLSHQSIPIPAAWRRTLEAARQELD